MTVSQDIRGAIQERAATASGFPADPQVHYQGLTFKPTKGVKWARVTVIPSTTRPFDVAAGRRSHVGLAIVTVFIPANGGQGTGLAEIAADNVCAVFPPGARLFQGGERVNITYSERKQAVVEPDWISCPVEIAWTTHSTSA